MTAEGLCMTTLVILSVLQCELNGVDHMRSVLWRTVFMIRLSANSDEMSQCDFTFNTVFIS